MLGMADHIETSILHTTVRGAELARDATLHVRGEFFSLSAVVVSFQSTGITFPGVVIMHTNKDGFAIPIANTDAAGREMKTSLRRVVFVRIPFCFR